MTIHVFVPAYNCEEYIGRCLDSVCAQHFRDFTLTVIDDASTDNTWPIIDANYSDSCDYADTHSMNYKMPFNLFQWVSNSFSYVKPEDVIFLLDGDDFLPHENVLQRVDGIFSDPDVWLTYGQYDVFPHNTGQVPAEPYPDDVVQDRSFRATKRQLFNHPLIFRKFLFDAIPVSEFKDRDGEWFRIGYDKVIMLPMMEMAAPDHLRYIDDVLYTYNSVNPLSEVHREEFQELEANVIEIWDRPKMGQLIR